MACSVDGGFRSRDATDSLFPFTSLPFEEFSCLQPTRLITQSVGKFGRVCMATRCVNITTYVLVRRWVSFGRPLSQERGLDFEAY